MRQLILLTFLPLLILLSHAVPAGTIAVLFSLLRGFEKHPVLWIHPFSGAAIQSAIDFKLTVPGEGDLSGPYECTDLSFLVFFC